eukprot:3790208-Rhodomonas_salina.1
MSAPQKAYSPSFVQKHELLTTVTANLYWWKRGNFCQRTVVQIALTHAPTTPNPAQSFPLALHATPLTPQEELRTTVEEKNSGKSGLLESCGGLSTFLWSPSRAPKIENLSPDPQAGSRVGHQRYTCATALRIRKEVLAKSVAQGAVQCQSTGIARSPLQCRGGAFVDRIKRTSAPLLSADGHRPALNNTTARGSTMVGRAVNGAEHVQLAGAPQLAPGDVLNPASNPLPMPSVAKPLLGGLSLPSSLAPDLVAQAIQSNRASQEAFSAALAASKENSPTIN